MNRIKSTFTVFVAVLATAAIGSSSASAALLDGQTVQYQYLFNTITSNYASADNGNKLVGPGIEVSNITDNVGTIDISDTNLTANFATASFFSSSGSFNGFRITAGCRCEKVVFYGVNVPGAAMKPIAIWEIRVNGFRITDVNGTIDDFVGVSINPATNMAGLDASRISFDADNIWVNWQSLSFDPNTIVSLDITAVPEPATAMILGLGLAGLTARRRRRA